MTVRAIVLAGGAGSRLWPLSTPARPKPLVDLLGEGPMVRATLARVAALASARPVVVGAQALAGALVAALQGDADVLAEPAPRGTAAAVTAAALRVDPAEVLLVLPADHHVVDRPAFHAALTVAVRHAEAGRLVFSSLETNTAAEALNRIVRSFATEDQSRITDTLSAALLAVVSQSLVPTVDNLSREMVHEVLVHSPLLCHLLRKGQTEKIASYIQHGSKEGTVAFDDHLWERLQLGLISQDTALAAARDKREFARRIRGTDESN